MTAPTTAPPAHSSRGRPGRWWMVSEVDAAKERAARDAPRARRRRDLGSGRPWGRPRLLNLAARGSRTPRGRGGTSSRSIGDLHHRPRPAGRRPRESKAAPRSRPRPPWSRERSGVEGRASSGGEGERGWRDPCPRGAKHIEDDVEALVVAAVGLDVQLEDWRGVAPAGSVLEVERSCTLHDGAGEARGRSSGSGAPQPAGTSQQAIERIQANAAMSCERVVLAALVCSIAPLDGCARPRRAAGGRQAVGAGAGRGSDDRSRARPVLSFLSRLHRP